MPFHCYGVHGCYWGPSSVAGIGEKKLGNSSISCINIPLTRSVVSPDDKRRLLDLESELWQRGPEHAELTIGGCDKLLNRGISRYNILTAHHRLDNVGFVNDKESGTITALAQELARGDPDVPHALVTEFEDVSYQWRGQEDKSVQDSILFLLSILNEDCTQDVKAVAMSKLGTLLSSYSPRRDSSENTSISRYITSLEPVLDSTQGSVHSSPQIADGAIRLQGAVLSRSAMSNFASFPDTYGSLGSNKNVLETWTKTLRLAGHECNVSNSITPGDASTKL